MIFKGLSMKQITQFFWKVRVKQPTTYITPRVHLSIFTDKNGSSINNEDRK